MLLKYSSSHQNSHNKSDQFFLNFFIQGRVGLPGLPGQPGRHVSTTNKENMMSKNDNRL